jgi:hypothetical protein
LIDEVGGKLLLVAGAGIGAALVLTRCNLDGSACTHTDISAGEAASSRFCPSSVIDSRTGTLFIVTLDANTSAGPSLFRCNVDGTGCTHHDISAGHDVGSGDRVAVAIDTLNDRLLAVTMDRTNSGNPALFRCSLEGTECTYADISAGMASDPDAPTGLDPSIVVDTVHAKLLTVTFNGPNLGRPSLFRCDLDGGACAFADISAGQGALSGLGAKALLDVAHGKLLVVTQNGGNRTGVPVGRLSMFRCNPDGTECTHTDLSAEADAGMNLDSAGPSAVIDALRDTLLIAFSNSPNHANPSLFQCRTDGSGCTHSDISAGQGDNSPIGTALDSVHRRLLVVAENGLYSEKLALFLVPLK